jgi:hypothetical protein
MDTLQSLARNVNGFQTTFCGMLSAWSASFLADMTRTSRATNRQDCKAVAFSLSGKAIMHSWRTPEARQFENRLRNRRFSLLIEFRVDDLFRAPLILTRQ